MWSLLALLFSVGLYATATSITWLFVARTVQGLATGGALGAAGAALIDLYPSSDARRRRTGRRAHDSGALAQLAGPGLSNRALTAAGAGLVPVGMAFTAVSVAAG